MINNCFLLINWSYVGYDTMYDIEAIDKLNPKMILIISEEMTGAGSIYLHEWMKESGAPTKFSQFINDTIKKEFKYIMKKSKYKLIRKHQIELTENNQKKNKLFPFISLFEHI